MNRNKVLIFAPIYDVHAAAVVYGLRKNAFVDIWTSNISSLKEVTITAECPNEWSATFGDNCAASSIISAWFRRPSKSEVSKGCNLADQKFVEHEWSAFQRNVFDLSGRLAEFFWINDPAAARRAESKLLQLHAASDVGLQCPATIVSNNPSVLSQKFVELIGSPVVSHIVQARLGESDERATESGIDFERRGTATTSSVGTPPQDLAGFGVAFADCFGLREWR